MFSSSPGMRRQWPAHRVQPGLEPSIHLAGPLGTCRVCSGTDGSASHGSAHDPRTQGLTGKTRQPPSLPSPRRCGEDPAKPPSSLARMVCPALFTVRLSQRRGRAFRTGSPPPSRGGHPRASAALHKTGKQVAPVRLVSAPGQLHRNRAMAAGRRRRDSMTRSRRQSAAIAKSLRIIPAQTGCGTKGVCALQ